MPTAANFTCTKVSLVEKSKGHCPQIPPVTMQPVKAAELSFLIGVLFLICMAELLLVILHKVMVVEYVYIITVAYIYLKVNPLSATTGQGWPTVPILVVVA